MAQFPVNFAATGQPQALPVVNVPNGATQAVLSLDGATMTDPAMHASVTLDFSVDNGATFASQNPGPATNPYPVTMEIQGGTKDKHGNPLPSYDLGVPLPSPQLTTRKITGSVTVTGAALNTTGTLTIT